MNVKAFDVLWSDGHETERIETRGGTVQYAQGRCRPVLWEIIDDARAFIESEGGRLVEIERVQV